MFCIFLPRMSDLRTNMRTHQRANGGTVYKIIDHWFSSDDHEKDKERLGNHCGQKEITEK